MTMSITESTTSPVSGNGSVSMRGWVQKKSAMGISGWRVWQSRLLEVRHDSLQYFSFSDAVVPRGVIPFEQIRGAVLCGANKSAGRFDVTSTQRTYAFTCGQSDEAARWIGAVNAAQQTYINSLTTAPAVGRGRVVQSRRPRRMSYVHAAMHFDFELDRVYEPQTDTDTTALNDEDEAKTLEERDSPTSATATQPMRATTSASPSPLQLLIALAILRAEQTAAQGPNKRLVHSAPASPVALPLSALTDAVKSASSLSEERLLDVLPNNCVTLRLILRHMSALTVSANVASTVLSPPNRTHSRSVSAVSSYARSESQPNLLHRRMRYEKQVGLNAVDHSRALSISAATPVVDIVPAFITTALMEDQHKTDANNADTSATDDDDSDVKAAVERLAPIALNDLITNSPAEFIRVLLEIFERFDNRRAHALAVRVLFLLIWQQRRYHLAGHGQANALIVPAILYLSACRGNISSTTYDSDVSTGDDDSGGDNSEVIDGIRNVARIDSDISERKWPLSPTSLPFRHSYSGPQTNSPHTPRTPTALADHNSALSTAANDTFAASFVQLITLCCGGRKFSSIVRDAIFACLLQTAAEMADAISARTRYTRSLSSPTLSALALAAKASDTTANDSGADVFTVSMSMKVVHSEVWPALFAILNGAAINMRERTLADINSILIRQHDNVTSLQSIHRWSAYVYPLFADIDRRLVIADTLTISDESYSPAYQINATMEALMTTVSSCHALTINVIVVVLYDNMTALTPTQTANPFLRSLTAVMDELLIFAGTTYKSRVFAVSLLSALLHKIQSARAIFIRSPPASSAAWLNLMPLVAFIKRFIFQTETWIETAANADSFNVLDAIQRARKGVRLSSALQAESDGGKSITFDAMTSSSTFALHWTATDANSPARMRDLPLIERLLNTLTALDVAKFDAETNVLAPADTEVVSTLHSAAFLFFSDARVFLPALNSIRSDRQSISGILSLYFASKSTADRTAIAVQMDLQLRPIDRDSAMFDSAGKIQLSKKWAMQLQKITGINL